MKPPGLFTRIIMKLWTELVLRWNPWQPCRITLMSLIQISCSRSAVPVMVWVFGFSDLLFHFVDYVLMCHVYTFHCLKTKPNLQFSFVLLELYHYVAWHLLLVFWILAVWTSASDHHSSPDCLGVLCNSLLQLSVTSTTKSELRCGIMALWMKFIVHKGFLTLLYVTTVYLFTLYFQLMLMLSFWTGYV